MKATATVSEVELLAGVLYDYLHQRLVQVVMRQKADDLTDIAVACTNVLRLDRTLRKLEEQGLSHLPFPFFSFRSSSFYLIFIISRLH